MLGFYFVDLKEGGCALKNSCYISGNIVKVLYLAVHYFSSLFLFLVVLNRVKRLKCEMLGIVEALKHAEMRYRQVSRECSVRGLRKQKMHI